MIKLKRLQELIYSAAKSFEEAESKLCQCPSRYRRQKETNHIVRELNKEQRKLREEERRGRPDADIWSKLLRSEEPAYRGRSYRSLEVD